MKIVEKTKWVRDETILTIEKDRLIISTRMFERIGTTDEWWESCGSTLSLPLKKVKSLLTEYKGVKE
jgi:hypothetical protein